MRHLAILATGAFLIVNSVRQRHAAVARGIVAQRRSLRHRAGAGEGEERRDADAEGEAGLARPDRLQIQCHLSGISDSRSWSVARPAPRPA